MEILFSDQDIAVCIKPVGLDSEQDVPRALQSQLGGQVFPLHRLDKNVGGLMVYARNKAAAASLSRCIQEGHMIKEYVAMVHGTPPESGTWKDLLFKDSRKNKVFVVRRSRAGVKEASLEFFRLTPGHGDGSVSVQDIVAQGTVLCAIETTHRTVPCVPSLFHVM